MVDVVEDVRLRLPSKYFTDDLRLLGDWVRLADFISDPEVIRIPAALTNDNYDVNLLSGKTAREVLMVLHKVACDYPIPLYMATMARGEVYELNPQSERSRWNTKKQSYLEAKTVLKIENPCEVLDDKSETAQRVADEYGHLRWSIKGAGTILYSIHEGEWNWDEPTWFLNAFGNMERWNRLYEWQHQISRIDEREWMSGLTANPETLSVMNTRLDEDFLLGTYVFIPSSDGLGVLNARFTVGDVRKS